MRLTEAKFRLCETGFNNSVFGRLVYATESCDPVRRWQRMLDRYCAKILRDRETLRQGLMISDRKGGSSLIQMGKTAKNYRFLLTRIKKFVSQLTQQLYRWVCL